MKTRLLLITAAFMGFGAVSAQACELHSGFGSPFGMQWEPANAEKLANQYGEDNSYTAVKTNETKTKPVFSRAANRASDIAKLRIKKKDEAEAKTEATVKLAKVEPTQ